MSSINLESIDFEAVLSQFAAKAASSKSAKLLMEASSLKTPAAMRNALAPVGEAAKFFGRGADVSLGGLSDIAPYVKSAKKGLMLRPEELLAISLFLSAAKAVKNAFDPQLEPVLADLADTLDICSRLAEAIDDAIDLSGQIKPDASDRLLALSGRLQAEKARLSAAARSFIAAHGSSLVDTTTAYAGGRLCVLVKASDKYKFGGIVHGQTASKAGSYLEPAELASINNSIADTESEIEEERKRICRQLSGMVKTNAKALFSDDETLTAIDMALAKAKWMIEHDGCVPVVHADSHALSIEHAVHPLLERQSAVANSYSLRADQSCLMITGSNMGGKTVTLKTIALFVMLAHCGYPVSAHQAYLPLYRRFYFDIGDAQSIENNLSTFSAHASRIAYILKKADKDAFVLLDEIGSGTDPAEGAALAQAILEALVEKGATVLTSTHYGQVKTYGKTDPRVLIGSVEFDPVSLKPTYRFLPGVSGASCAFHIAGQYGMNHLVLQRARELKKENESETARQLEALEKQQAKVQKQKDRFDALVKDAHRLQKKADEDQKKYAEMKKRLDDDYARRLDDMLYEKKEEARAIVRELKASAGKASHEQIEKMGELSALGVVQEKKAPEAKKAEPIQAGDYVHVTTLNNHGEVVEVRKKKATVMVNGRKVVVPVDQLEKTARPKTIKTPHKKESRQPDFRPFPLELNIIGMRVEEGLRELDHYIDQAVYHNVKNVRIIHGMGTGALRNAVMKDLRGHPNVASFAAGGPSEGGLGATIVELR